MITDKLRQTDGKYNHELEPKDIWYSDQLFRGEKWFFTSENTNASSDRLLDLYDASILRNGSTASKRLRVY